ADHPYGGAAAVELRELAGVEVDVGRHDLAKIRSAAGVVVSPGVPPDAAPLAAAREAGVPVVSEIDLGFRALAGSGTRCIAITGTNGKTTTTALVAHLLRAAGLAAEAAGSMGRPLTDIAVTGDRYQWLAVEVSSFQLHDSPHFAPEIGILTNLAPDHLDRYPSVDAYYHDKQLLFSNARPRDVWVLNGDDPAALELPGPAPGRRVLFSLRRPADGWYDPAARRLRLAESGLVPRGERPAGDRVRRSRGDRCPGARGQGVARARDDVRGCGGPRPARRPAGGCGPALSRVLEVRHVQELRGAGGDVPEDRGGDVTRPANGRGAACCAPTSIGQGLPVTTAAGRPPIFPR